MRLKDQIAIVTGAGRGIGAAIAVAYAREGAHLVLASRTLSELDAVADKVHALGREALITITDVTVEESVAAMAASALDKFGRIDILVNNAGAGMLRHIWRTSLESWDYLIDLNLRGPFLCSKHVWQAMQKGGGGAIINIGSTSGSRAFPLMSAYSASKWGLVGLTKACAAEGRADNIRVNIINVGKANAGARGAIADKEPILEAEDLVGTAIFLAWQDARHVHGQVIEVEVAPEDPIARRRRDREAARK
jgi:NAD(P)-dependent dehydrogenase (short-subunit alcohol dehydrogenase family)